MADIPIRKHIESGAYRIFAVDFPENSVGRSPVEDFSLLPKAVFNLTKGTDPLWPWIVIRHENGKYELKATNAPTGVKENQLFAFLMDEKPVEWTLTPARTTTGKEGWIIEHETPAGPEGWHTGAATEFPGAPVKVGPLPATKSLPPQYFPGAVFEFKEYYLKK